MHVTLQRMTLTFNMVNSSLLCRCNLDVFNKDRYAPTTRCNRYWP